MAPPDRDGRYLAAVSFAAPRLLSADRRGDQLTTDTQRKRQKLHASPEPWTDKRTPVSSVSVPAEIPPTGRRNY